MASRRSITVPTGYTLIFWGNNFDESAAIIFASTLRDAGICVKMVGLHGLQAAGQNGVTLNCDISVSDISEIAEQIRCVIFPCNSNVWQCLANDPRMQILFAQAAEVGATVVIGTTPDLIPALASAAICKERIFPYPDKENLLKFAGMIAHKLSGRLTRLFTQKPDLPQLASPTFI